MAAGLGIKATLLILTLVSLQIIIIPIHAIHDVKAIYQFGDSLSDTGNLIRENPIGGYFFARLPYGLDFFRRPTGRCSDGLLMIDYIAKYFKLPLLDPYLNKDGNFTRGDTSFINFAIAGSTALDAATLKAKNITLPVTNSSLSVQLNWFKSHLDSICSSPSDCKHKLKNALFMIGETGGNDFNYALVQGKTMSDLQNMVADVVHAIKHAVNVVISLGATRVVVPGNFAIGCMPIYLANFGGDDPNMYDDLKCLKGLNEFAKFQNSHVQQAVRELQQAHPHVTIVYGDYFNALKQIIRFASLLGFDEDATKMACCGSGDNAYNFNITTRCGTKEAQVCKDPHSHVNWDGIHLTTHAYFHVAKSLLKKIVPAISHPCV